MLAIRANYLAAKEALPWLDAWRPQEFEAQFPEAPQSKIPAAKFPDGIRLVMATRNSLDEVEAILQAGETVVYGTGDRKLIYDYVRLCDLLRRYPRFYLATANLCNILTFERMHDLGVTGQLLYGSGMPFLDENAAMGQLALSKLDWKIRCDIAGNNVRRLLGMPEIMPSEPQVLPVEPFIIDAHGHTSNIDGLTPMPTSVVGFTWEQWRPLLDFYGTEILIDAPNIAFRTEWTSLASEGVLARESGGRIRLLEIYDPRDPKGVDMMRSSLAQPECVGVKIHPQFHLTWASDDRYDAAFRLAGEAGKTVMSHTWEISYYNPRQKFSCPWLFEEHIARHPETNFVLGHAGGRPSTLFEVRELCRRYPSVFVDISGDYFHNGMIGNLVSAIGPERILFGADIDWFDPRCVLGIVLGSELSDADVMLVLRENAKRVYHLAGTPVSRLKKMPGDSIVCSSREMEQK